ncbi:MAG: PadR family transcriptional regulator [Candidatus Bathyarchaeia archaeon]|jgi:DNA-binding PadR family transcriptional regulator
MLSSQNVMNVNKIIERHLKAFLDIVILAILNGGSMHGYKIIAAIHKEFGILLSPGSLYPLLHCLEEDKLIQATFDRGKIVYSVTLQGKEKFGKAFAAYNFSIQKMSRFVRTHGETSPQLIQEAKEEIILIG